jgi:hypothetical protein
LIYQEDEKMKNVEMKVEGNILTIKVDLTKEFGPSSSGKTIIIGSTEGNVAILEKEEVKIGLNVYRKK